MPRRFLLTAALLSTTALHAHVAPQSSAPGSPNQTAMSNVPADGQPHLPTLIGRSTAWSPQYSGNFDHFGVDTTRNRLLLAAEDHGTVEGVQPRYVRGGGIMLFAVNP